MHEANIAYGFDFRHPSNIPGFLFGSSTYAAPQNEFLLMTIVQDRKFRFKQLFIGIDGSQWNGSGMMLAVARFFDYNSPPLLEIPIAYCPLTSSSINPFYRTGHITTVQATPPTGNFYQWNDLTGGANSCQKTLDLEIVCDYITLSVNFNKNQWTGPIGIAICKGFTRPPRMYHEYNFESLP